MREFERAFGELPEETRQRIRNTLDALPDRKGSRAKRGFRGGLAGRRTHPAARWAAASAAALVLAFGALCAVNPDVAMAVPVVRDLFRLMTKAGVEGFENLPELEGDGTFTVKRIEQEVTLPTGSRLTIGEAFFDGRVVNISYHYEPFAARPAVDLGMSVIVDGDDRGGERRSMGTSVPDEAIRAYMTSAGLPQEEFAALKSSPWFNREETGYVRVEIDPQDLSRSSVALKLSVNETQPLPQEALGDMKVDASTRLERVMPLAQDPRDAAMRIDRETGADGDHSALSQVSMTSIPIGADVVIPIEVSMELPKGTTFAQKTVEVDAVRLEIACTRTPMRTYVRVRETDIPGAKRADGTAAGARNMYADMAHLWLTDEKGNRIEAEGGAYGGETEYVSQLDFSGKADPKKAVYLHYAAEQQGVMVERCEPILLP